MRIESAHPKTGNAAARPLAPASQPPILCFGPYEVDERLFELRKHGRPVHVQRRVLDLIIFLLRHRERVVSKAELIAGPWGGTSVSNAALNQAIKSARQALEDDSHNPALIVTVRGRGFRFASNVRVSPGHGNAEVESRAHSDELPAPSGVTPAFVGRRQELAALHAEFEQASAGRGRLVLLNGAPGVGKTSLVDRFVSERRALGTEVLRGWCWDGATPLFWPWQEVLRGYCEERTPAARAAMPSELCRLVPDIYARQAALLEERPSGDVPEERFRIIEALKRFLFEAARTAPLLVVLEDLHAADENALRALEFLALSIERAPLLVVGVCRPLESESRPTLTALLRGALPHVHHLALAGLGETAIDGWLTQTVSGELPSSAAALVHAATGGHPFLIMDLLRSSSGAWLVLAERALLRGIELPERLAGGIRRRLARLPHDTLATLLIGATLGREFEAALAVELGSASGVGDCDVLLPALREGLVVRAPLRAGHLRFAHDLVRETLYFDLELDQRFELHARVSAALSARAEPAPGAVFEAAHHALRAGSVLPIELLVASALKLLALARQSRHDDAFAPASACPMDPTHAEALVAATLDALSSFGTRPA